MGSKRTKSPSDSTGTQATGEAFREAFLIWIRGLPDPDVRRVGDIWWHDDGLSGLELARLAHLSPDETRKKLVTFYNLATEAGWFEGKPITR